MKVFDNSEFDRYKTEAKEKWGHTDAYKEHEGKTKNYSQNKWDSIAEGLDNIMAEFALCMKNGDAPESAEAQNLVKKLQAHITANYYNCTDEILKGIGKMYVADERFKNNIDKHGEGTAEYICKTIEAH